MTYQDVRHVLIERYGSQKTAEMARNNFGRESWESVGVPHMRQEKIEASEDFLDHLSREYRRGWADERSQCGIRWF